MRKNKILTLLTPVVLIIVLILFFTIILNSTKTINCHGVIYALGGGRFFDGSIEYYIKGGEGHVKVAGKVGASQSIKIVSRVIYFSVTQQGEQFLMTSTKVIKTKTDNVDDAELGVVLPSFYIFKGVQFSVNIKDLTNGKMFYTSRLPSLYVSIR